MRRLSGVTQSLPARRLLLTVQSTSRWSARTSTEAPVMSSYLVNINGILFLLTYLQVLFVYGGSVSSTGDQFRLRGSVSSTGDQFRLRGISFVYGDQFRLRGISFVYGGSVSSTGDQFRLRGISCFRKVAWTAGKTGRTGAAVGCDAARPAARRRVGEPAASAERERRGRQRRCLRLLTYLLRGISCVYGGSVCKQLRSTAKYDAAPTSGDNLCRGWPADLPGLVRPPCPVRRAGQTAGGKCLERLA